MLASFTLPIVRMLQIHDQRWTMTTDDPGEPTGTAPERRTSGRRRQGGALAPHGDHDPTSVPPTALVGRLLDEMR
jgi:hypothetical protein